MPPSYSSSSSDKLEFEVNLGRCSPPAADCDGASQHHVGDWVRSHTRVPTFDSEQQAVWLFGFSLAHCDKLWTDNEDRLGADVLRLGEEGNAVTAAVRSLFRIHESCHVVVLHDSEAHLLGSRYHFTIALPQQVNAAATVNANNVVVAWREPMINVSVGTGFGMALTNSKGELRRPSYFKDMFGCSPWDLPSAAAETASREEAYFALTKDALREIEERRDSSQSPAIQFRNKYADFVLKTLFPLYDRIGWTKPTACCLTGGVIDHIGEDMIPGRAITLSVEEGGGNRCEVTLLRGPPAAGHIGVCAVAFGLIGAVFD